MTVDEAVQRHAAHVATAAEVFLALDELVLALDNTNWSSWQTTVAFSAQLEVARHVVARAKATGEQS